MSLSSKSSSSSSEKSQSTSLIKNKLLNDKNISLSESSESSILNKFDQNSVSSKNSSKSSLKTVKDDSKLSKESFVSSKNSSTASLNLLQDSNFEVTSGSHEINEKSNKSEASILKDSTKSKTSNSNTDLSQSNNENSGQLSNKIPVFSRERNLGIKKQNKNITNETAGKELTESLKSESSSSISSLVRNGENADEASENTKLSEASKKISHKSSTSLDSKTGSKSKSHESKLAIDSEKTNNVENDKFTNKLTSKNSLENVSKKLQESEVTTKTSAKVIPSVTQIDDKVECSTSVEIQSSSSSSNSEEKTNRVSSADTMRSVRSISPDFKDANAEVVDEFDHKKFLSTLNKFDVKQKVKCEEVPVKENPEKKVFKNKVRDLIMERFGLPHHLKARMNASLFISGAVSLVLYILLD